MKMKSLLNGNVWLWDRGKFMNRRFLMQVLKSPLEMTCQTESRNITAGIQ